MPPRHGGTMDIAPLTVLLRLLGTGVLMAVGTVGGIQACRQKKQVQHQLYTWYRFFCYLQQILGYYALTGDEMLACAKDYPEFFALGLEHCSTLEQLPLPEVLTAARRREVYSALRQLAMQPRTVACQTLQYVAELFRDAAAEKGDEIQTAEKLWPKLGFCAGTLTAILLW